jgi:hypothetical protein
MSPAAPQAAPPIDPAAATKMLLACAIPLGLPAGTPVQEVIDHLSDLVEALQPAAIAAPAELAARRQLTASERRAVRATPGATALSFLAAKRALRAR